MSREQIVVIGGGAAGFFGALTCAEQLKNADITILERHSRFLNKVRISGGGRCNVTHHCFEPAALIKNYPRGNKELRNVFNKFQPQDTMQWFEARNVALKTEEDERVFPVSNSSETIIECLMQEANKLNVQLRDSVSVQKIEYHPADEFPFHISTNRQAYKAHQLLIACGGFPKTEQYTFLADLGIPIIEPVPSLFTFHIADPELHALAGISVPHAVVRIQGAKIAYEGPLLITHWGVSGPAVLKTSAWHALELYEKNYHFNIHINWVGVSEEELRRELTIYKKDHAKRKVVQSKIYHLPTRLWNYICQEAEINEEIEWGNMPNKLLNKLVDQLVNTMKKVMGKSANKEEFVTAGGVHLKDIQMQTMESKTIKGLYFAGEILNIDGVTGGFNFQAAWSTGWLAGKAMAQHTLSKHI
jgi:predicted Rossmann fold flavoprotein